MKYQIQIQNTHLDLTCLETVAAVTTCGRFAVRFHMCKRTRLSLTRSKDRMGIHGGAKLSFSNSCFVSQIFMSFFLQVPLGSPKSCVQCHIQWWCGSREFIARPPCLQKSVRRIAIFRWGTTWDKSNKIWSKPLQPRYVAMVCVVLLSLISHFTSIWLKERILFKISFFFGPSLKWASRFQCTGVFHGASKGCWRQRTERRGRGETAVKMIWIIRDIPAWWSENCKILLCPFWLLC